MFQNEALLNIMEQLLGTPDIQAHPAWAIRTKVPNNNSGTVPWHQGRWRQQLVEQLLINL